jgi:site-specific DNA-adenine methylase
MSQVKSKKRTPSHVDAFVSEHKKSNVYYPVKALMHTAPYKIHKYFARRPWNVFLEIIKSFSKQNDIILDPFCGGGVTLYEGLKINRKVVGFDLNPLSIFIVNNMISKGDDLNKLFKVFELIINRVDALYKQYYYFESKGERIEIDWIEVTYRVKCPECKKITFLSNKFRKSPGYYFCKNNQCVYSEKNGKAFAQRYSQRVGHEYLYLVGFNSNKEKVFYKPLKKDLREALMLKAAALSP